MTSLTLSGSLSDSLPVLDSISLLINPYPLVSQAVTQQMNNAVHLRVLNYATALTIIHSIIIIQTAVLFILKFWRKDVGSISFRPWSKSYQRDQTFPHLIPNGNLLNDVLQILSSVSMEWFVSLVHKACTDPQSVSPLRLETAVFWLALVFVPVLIGLWLNGWSCIYIGFFSPARNENKALVYRFLQHPLMMNFLCLGIPILVIIYFLCIGIELAITLRRLVDTYSVVIKTLALFSKAWVPNDLESIQKNQRIFNMFTTIYNGGAQIGNLFQCLAYATAAISFFLIIFYIAATLELGKVLKQSLQLRGASEKKLATNDTKEDYGIWASQSNDTLSGLQGYNKEHTLKLQRTYYLASLSSSLISLALGFLIATCLVVGLKAKVVLFDLNWQLRTCKLATGASVALSFSLTIQNILLIWNEARANSRK